MRGGCLGPHGRFACVICQAMGVPVLIGIAVDFCAVLLKHGHVRVSNTFNFLKLIFRLQLVAAQANHSMPKTELDWVQIKWTGTLQRL